MAVIFSKITLVVLGSLLVLALVFPAISTSLTDNERVEIAERGENLYVFFYKYRVKLQTFKDRITPASDYVKKPTIYTNTRTGVLPRPGRPVPAQWKTVERLANRIGKLSVLSSKIKNAALLDKVTNEKILKQCIGSLEELKDLVESKLMIQELDFQGIMVFEDTLNSWRNTGKTMVACRDIINSTKDETNWQWLTSEDDLIN